MGRSKVVRLPKKLDGELVDALYQVPHKLTQEQQQLVQHAKNTVDAGNPLTSDLKAKIISIYRDIRLGSLERKANQLPEEQRQAALSMPVFAYETMPRPLKPPGRS